MMKKNKCTQCKSHNARRYCLRIDKRVCWLCCNMLRSDFKCPEPCEYHLEDKSDITQMKIKSDCLAELYDLLDKYIKVWIRKKSDLFDGQLPIVMAETDLGKAELVEKLSKTNIDQKIAKLYEKHLDIDLESKNFGIIKSFEDVAVEFLSAIAHEKWDNLPSFLRSFSSQPIETIISRLKKKHELSKLVDFLVIASGISKDGISGFCSVEIDLNTDLIVILRNHDNEWLVENVIFGDFELLFKENDTIKQIATALGKKDYNDAWVQIIAAEECYYLSADVQYYKGLYFMLSEDPEKALLAFSEASNLDPNFAEAIYNQAFIYHSINKLDEAKELYQKVIDLAPKSINALNNLGTIYLYEKKYDEALECLNKCLEIAPDNQHIKDNIKLVEQARGV